VPREAQPIFVELHAVIGRDDDNGTLAERTPLQIVEHVARQPLPWIFSGLRISMALALTASVVGEMLAAQYGLGFLLARASGTFDTTGIFMVLIILALLAIGTYNLMARLEKRLLHWQGETASI